MAVDSVVEFVPNPWYSEKDCRLDFYAFVCDSCQIGDEVDVYTTADHPMQIEGASKGVGPWKECSVLIADIDLECRFDTQNVGECVPVAEHDSLWVASGSLGVDEGVEGKWVVRYLKGVL